MRFTSRLLPPVLALAACGGNVVVGTPGASTGAGAATSSTISVCRVEDDITL